MGEGTCVPGRVHVRDVYLPASILQVVILGPLASFNSRNSSSLTKKPRTSIQRKCLRLSEFLMGSRQNFSDRFLILRSSTAFPCRVRRSRDGGPEIRALIAAAVPWLARAMAAETRLLIGHTSLCAAAAAVRTPMIAHALVLHSRHRWKGDWRCLLGRGGPHACSVRQWCVWSSTHSPH